MKTMEETLREAKSAKTVAATLSSERKNQALSAMADALISDTPRILAANQADVSASRLSPSMTDRLTLTEKRIAEMSEGIRAVAKLPDPVGRVLEKSLRPNGLKIEKVSVPMGVVAVIYESRPNVTSDAAALCLKSGNACVLRGGSLAAKSCAAIAHVLHDAAVSAGMPAGCIGIIESTDRAAADVLMGLRGVVDVLVPRGGAGLIAHCVDCAKVPVIETGTGNCHVYVHSTADFDMARNIVVNAKCRRYGVCNACETLLVDQSVAERFLPELFGMLADKGVRIHGDELACKAALAAGEKRLPTDAALQVERASEQDWETEYLSPDLAVRCVSGPEQAIAHINRYGTMHSEAIVADPNLAEGAAAIERFVNEVDAAAVYVNASTAFTDGGMFGLGAEIGISTQKLHVRGPFALEGLTSYKYVLRGSGQVRA